MHFPINIIVFYFQDCGTSRAKQDSKLVSVGYQKILFNLFDTSGDGEDEEFASACRMADSVLLCYKASDLQSLQMLQTNGSALSGNSV